MSAVGEKFVAAALSSSVVDYLKLGRLHTLFEFVPNEQKLFAALDTYVRLHGALPTKGILEDELGTKLPEPEGALTYWHNKLIDRHLRRGIMKASDTAEEKYKAGDGAEKVLAYMMGELNRLNTDRLGPKLHDFRQAAESIEAGWLPSGKEAVMFGWPYLDDKLMSSAMPGDLISMVGRPGMGKTYLLLYSALTAWRVQKLPVLFISMEVAPKLLQERLAAMATSTPHDWIKANVWPSHGKDGTVLGKGKDNPHKKKFMSDLKMVTKSGVPFHLVDGSLAATVDDIYSLAVQLKPAMIYVDGAYLVKDPRENDIYKRVANTANRLKSDICTMLGIPVYASWQFSKEMTKLKKGEIAGLQHIAHADVIGQLSSIVMGLFQDDTVETMIRRRVSLLKGRSGEVGEFSVNWNFAKMDFSEADDSSGELSFID